MRIVEFDLPDNNGKMLVNPGQVVLVYVDSGPHGGKTIMHFTDGTARATKGSLEEVREKLDKGLQ